VPEAGQQRTISDIFDTLGEEAFRQMESAALQARVRAVAEARKRRRARSVVAARQDKHFGRR
jgi:shikimate kinase